MWVIVSNYLQPLVVKSYHFCADYCRLEQGLAQYRMWVEAEEKASADPVKHQEFLTVSHLSSTSSLYSIIAGMRKGDILFRSIF
jgi:hypothetical protein